ncbi:MAG: hypothetical protein A2Z27_05830 [candidate division Zixibacteria bacterium RBG_16_50_21]|nr:MAG: hypothetical protein A2Z27_05830 [candidate division Zixibacteria bacterium RBG_16_50_21]
MSISIIAGQTYLAAIRPERLYSMRGGWVDEVQNRSALSLVTNHGVCPPAKFSDHIQSEFEETQGVVIDGHQG